MSSLKKVTIVGFYNRDMIFMHPSELRFGGAEVWSLNNYHELYPDLRVDRVFEIHQWEKGRWRTPQSWLDAYRNSKAQCVFAQPVDGISNQIVFPLEDALRDWGTQGLTSTFSYMLYMAMRDGFDEVKLVGCRLKVGGEHEHEMPGLLRNIQKLKEAGIKVDNPRQTQWENDVKNLSVNWAEMTDKSFYYYGSGTTEAREMYSIFETIRKNKKETGNGTKRKETGNSKMA